MTGIGASRVFARDGLQDLIVALTKRGYQVLGPTLRDGVIAYDEVTQLDDLPRGWTDRQDAGRYRLEERGDEALFGYAVGPQSWKRFLHPPIERLWQVRRDGMVAGDEEVVPKFAFLGVRACELAAIAIQDKVFLGGAYRDTAYERRRSDNFIIALNCGEAGGTCFCVSMDTGPKSQGGFDLALTELLDGRHEFLVESGSDLGSQVLAELSSRPALAADIEAAQAVMANTAANMGRSLETGGLKELLQANLEHPRWNEVAERCLTCANCTMVCPTCFCTSVEDRTDLSGEVAERERKWDSCFTLDFSFVHGGSVRKQTRSRYRQWMTHKLANWIDQFGTSGCVGCGRCVTWCPVGIDITEEAAAIRATPGQKGGAHGGA